MCAVAASQRVRSRRTREVVEAQPQRRRCARPGRRLASAASPGRRARRASRRCRPRSTAPRPERALRADRPPPPADLRRAAGRGCARARAGGGPTARPSIDTSAVSPSSATSPTVVMPRSCSFVGGDRARRPTAARPAADAGSRARHRAGRPADRRAWRPRSRPWRGTSSARRRR